VLLFSFAPSSQSEVSVHSWLPW